MIAANKKIRTTDSERLLQEPLTTTDAYTRIPHFLQQLWAAEPPPPVRLSESHNAVERIFIFVLKARMAVGNAFVANLHHARHNSHNVLRLRTTSVVPIPRSTPNMAASRFYFLQATFALDTTMKSPFCEGTLPQIDFIDYATRFVTQSPIPHISPAVYLLTLAYLDKALARCPGLFLHSYNAHRLLLGAFICAIKFHEDDGGEYHHCAQLGGVPYSELAKIERSFFEAIDYRCFIPPEQFAALEIDIIHEAAEGPFASLVIPLLQSWNIAGTQSVIINSKACKSIWVAPKWVRLPLNVLNLNFPPIPVGKEFECVIQNSINFEQSTSEWCEERQVHLQIMAEAHWRALCQVGSIETDPVHRQKVSEGC